MSFLRIHTLVKTLNGFPIPKALQACIAGDRHEPR